MSSVVEAARLFVSGPSDIAAAQNLLSAYPLSVLCDTLIHAKTSDEAEPVESALERLADFEEVRANLLNPELLGFLQVGSTAASARIRKLVASLVRRLAQSDHGAREVAAAGLFAACEKLLLDEETGVGEASARALCSSCLQPAGRQAILGEGSGDDCVVGHLQSQLGSVDDVQRIRILCLFVDLGKTSDDVFSMLEGRGAYKAVLESFFTDDILLKLNAVELMESLGSFPAGQELLSREAVPRQLAKELSDPMNDESVQVCVVRLLGSVLQRNGALAEALLPEKGAPFPAMVQNFIESPDTTLRLCGLNAWADACTHEAGLAFFLRAPSPMERTCTLITASNNEVCKGAMAGWNAVLRRHEAPAPAVEEGAKSAAAEVWDMAEKSTLPAVLKNLSGKPFQDVRQETWRLLAVLARSRNVAQKILGAQEVRERLLDFGSETTYEAKIAKHEFVSDVVRLHGSWLPSFLDERVETLLRQIAKEGPTWMPQEASLLVNRGTA
mmetsp:Transcript_64012/g.152646  ORF Transcript_64012/g.152646 Transcript_64012/m.152646 type:complete len:500 (-) Transcript_64012:158-1657(-)